VSAPGSFRVDRVVDVASRQVVLLQGKMIAGEARPGMQVVIPWDEEYDLVVEVDSVDAAAPGAPGGLAVRWRNELERVLWRRLDLAGQTLEVRDAP